MSALTADENDWIFDYVMNVFRSPAWEVPVMCFLDANCAVFDAEDENKFAYSELHEQFRELVEGVLSDNLAEVGLSAADFADVCERSKGAGDVNADVVNQILAMDDFVTFKKLMVKRNLELELEAIRALRDEVADDADANASTRDIEAHLMELSVLYKQEEMEQAELEAALAMSLSVQEEELRRASVASKAAEDKFADPTAGDSPSPEEVHRQLRESKKKAEEICKKNKDALEENRSKQREWQQAVRRRPPLLDRFDWAHASTDTPAASSWLWAGRDLRGRAAAARGVPAQAARPAGGEEAQGARGEAQGVPPGAQGDASGAGAVVSIRWRPLLPSLAPTNTMACAPR